jgi:hypothetical protein
LIEPLDHPAQSAIVPAQHDVGVIKLAADVIIPVCSPPGMNVRFKRAAGFLVTTWFMVKLLL